MFTKLLKHELKAQGKVIGILSLASLGAGIIGSLMLAWLSNGITYATDVRAEAVKTVFSSMVLVGVFLGIAAYVVSVAILLLVRFYQRHFTDQGYLTFTLPATSHQILLSSIISIAIWAVISLVVTFASYIIVFLPVAESRDMIESIGDAYNDIFSILYGTNSNWIQLLSLLSSSLYSLILPLLAITIGSQIAKKHKLLAAFGIYYGLNMAISIITSVSSVFWLLSDSLVDFVRTMEISSMLTSLLHLGIAIGGYFIMHHLVDKKLNLP